MKGGYRYGAGRPARFTRTCDVRRIDTRILAGDRRADGVEVSYRYRFADGERDIHQRIAVEWTPCRFGGARAWFRCPRCERRCASIYAHGAPACRRCARLVYASTRDDAIDRSWRRTWAIERRLGWTDERKGSKPKGMHDATASRLHDAWQHEEELRDALMLAHVARVFPAMRERCR